MTIAISQEADRLFPQVGRVFGTALYANEELLFIDEHMGQSPGVAVHKGVPDGVLVDTVSPALQRIADLIQLAENGTPGLFASDELVATVRTAIRAHLGMAGERAERKEQNPGGRHNWPTLHGFDKLGRDLGAQAEGSDTGRVRATDVALLPIETFLSVDNYAAKYLKLMEDPLSSAKLTSEEIQAAMRENQKQAYGKVIADMTTEEKLDAETEHTRYELIAGPNFLECPICQERTTFNVSKDGEVAQRSYKSAKNKMVNHLKTAKNEAKAHRDAYRLEMKVQ